MTNNYYTPSQEITPFTLAVLAQSGKDNANTSILEGEEEYFVIFRQLN